MKPNLLIADDNDDVVKGFDILLRDDYQTTLAFSAADTLKALRENIFNVALLDLHFPDMTADDFCRGLLELVARPKIVILSGTDENDVGDLVRQLGPAAFLKKPAEVGLVRTALAEAVG